VEGISEQGAAMDSFMSNSGLAADSQAGQQSHIAVDLLTCRDEMAGYVSGKVSLL
jgi:hypothetical protein